MIKTLTITGWRRPDYLSQVLNSLKANNLQGYSKIYCALEPDNAENIEVCKQIDFIEKEIIVNPSNYGVRKNPFEVLNRAFSDGSDFNVYLEDDSILSPDAIALANFHLTEFGSDRNIIACCFDNVNSRKDLKTQCEFRNQFQAYVFSVTQQSYFKYFAPYWYDDIISKEELVRGVIGWDWSIRAVIKRFDLKVLTPCFSRCLNIGAYGGVYAIPEDHHRAFDGKEYCKENIGVFEYDKVAYKNRVQHNRLVRRNKDLTMNRATPVNAILVDDLLRLDDVDFVQAAYRAFLQRDPDPEGRDHFLRELRNGIAKRTILGDLQESDEGRFIDAAFWDSEMLTAQSKIMKIQQNTTLSIEDIMQRIHAEVARRKVDMVANGTAVVNTVVLDDLLRLEGAAFLQAAYQAFLNRNPDPKGIAYYERVLESGMTKRDILLQLHLSDEGKQVNTSVIGLETLTAQSSRPPTPRFDLPPLSLSFPEMTFVPQTQSLDLPRPTPLPDQPSYHVRDFLPFNEAEFIRVAHRAILRREADPSNLTNFLRSWHEGASKVYLLGQMRYSAEGEQHAVPITGLRARFLLEQAYHLPLIGYLLRWFVSLLTLPKRLRTLSRFADRVLVNEHHLATQVSGINHTTEQFYAQLSQFASNNDGNLRILRDAVDTLNANHQILVTHDEDLAARLDRHQRETTAAIHAEAQLANASYKALVTRAEALDARLEHYQQETSSTIRANSHAIDESRQAFATQLEKLSDRLDHYRQETSTAMHANTEIVIIRAKELSTQLDQYRQETAAAIQASTQTTINTQQDLITRVEAMESRLRRTSAVTYALTHQIQDNNRINTTNAKQVVEHGTSLAEENDQSGVKQNPPIRYAAIAPLVSIIIPTWNGGKFIKRCLDSLREHLTAPYEVIVVDNASDDLTVDIARRYSEVRLIQNPVNVGFGKAVNQGMRIAHPDSMILFWLNQDAYALSDWLTPVLKRFKSNHQLGVVGCKLLTQDGKVQHAGACSIEPRFDGVHYTEEPPVDAHFDYMTGAAFALRRECYDAVGDIDERFFPAYYEDVDYCLRTQAAGWQIAYEPKAILRHEPNQSSLHTYDLAANINVQRIRFIHKHKTDLEWLQSIWHPAEQSAIKQSNSVQWLYVMMHSYSQLRDDLAKQVNKDNEHLRAWWMFVLHDLVQMAAIRVDVLSQST